jgi:hypothetical protein
MATAKKRNERTSANELDELMVAEERAYYKKKAHLLQRYEGQFVALYQGRVVGHGPDDEGLALRMFEKLGDAPFYIQRVDKEPIIYEVPSPEVVR